MAFEPLELIEKHPYASAGVAAVIVLGAFLILSGPSSSGPATTTDPSTHLADAELAASAQQAQIQAQITGQANALKTQLDITNSNNAASNTQATLAAQVATTGQAFQYQIAAGQGQTQQYVANLSAQVANLQTITAGQVASDTIAAQVNIQKIISDAGVSTTQSNNAASLGIAGIQGQVAELMSTNQSQVSIAQTNAAVAIAKGQKSSNDLSTLAGIASIAAIALL